MSDHLQYASRQLSDLRRAADQTIRRNAAKLLDLGARAIGGAQAALTDKPPGKQTVPQRPIDRGAVNQRVGQLRDEVQTRYQLGKMAGDEDPAASAWLSTVGGWVDKVRPHGEWDDKQGHSGLQDQGNFSYGATAAALGFPDGVIKRAAGLVQRVQGVGDALAGRPPEKIRPRVGQPFDREGSFGDDPNDQTMIGQGIVYGRPPGTR